MLECVEEREYQIINIAVYNLIRHRETSVEWLLTYVSREMLLESIRTSDCCIRRSTFPKLTEFREMVSSITKLILYTMLFTSISFPLPLAVYIKYGVVNITTLRIAATNFMR